MTERGPLRTRSCVILLLVGLLLAATGSNLFHQHKDWADRGCQLCHVRHVSSLYSINAVAYGVPVLSQQHWNCDHSDEELETSVRSTPSRSPPGPISFTV